MTLDLQDVPGTVDHLIEAVDGADEVAPTARGRSRADQIRERRAKRAQKGPSELPLRLPEGEVVAVYRRPTMRQIRAATRGNKRPLAGNIEFLVQACSRIMLRDPDTGDEWDAAADTDHPDVPVRFDGRLRDLLGLTGKTPAEILVQTFEGNDRAIVSHAMRLDRWASGEDQDQDDPEEVDDLLGEADAAT